MDLPASVPILSRRVAGAAPFSITQEGGITIIALAGRITGCEIREAAEAVVQQPSFNPAQPRLWDARRITQVLLNVEQTNRDSVGKYAPHLGQGRAAVVARSGIDRTLAEFIRWHLRGRPIEAFTNIDEARAWLVERHA